MKQHIKNRAIHLTGEDELRLLQISDIVMSASNHEQALTQLENNLDASYKPAIAALRLLLNNQDKNIKPYYKYKGLWHVIVCVLQVGDQQKISYLRCYSFLRQAQTALCNAVKNDWLSIAYLLLLGVVSMIVISIYSIKVWPVMAQLFATMGSRLPLFTQTMMTGNSQLLSILFFTIAIFIILLPQLLFRDMQRLQMLPKYWAYITPFNACRRLYHHYLWLVYGQVFLKAGDDKPLEKATLLLVNNATVQLSANEQVLLHTAQQYGSLSQQLQTQAEQTLMQLQIRLTLINAAIKLVVFILIAIFIGSLVIAMYLPIFQMGALG